MSLAEEMSDEGGEVKVNLPAAMDAEKKAS
jgi:hypothetical protein